MKLIVGLGNMGKKYKATRHNVGFMVLDALAEHSGAKFSISKQHAEVAKIESATLAKPTTMMNLSGQAVGELMRFYKLSPSDVWVVYDDVDLPFGQLRVRQGGGSAGHNGVKSIIQHIGEDFWRIRIGIGNDFLPDTPTDQFVLDNFAGPEKTKLPEIINQAATLVVNSLEKGQIDEHSRSV